MMPASQIQISRFDVLLLRESWEREKTGTSSERTRMKIARLALVDDNQDNLEVLMMILGAEYDVSGYTSAQQALEALETVRPDALLLDIAMDPVDGLQCLRMIRARPGFERIPAIALTARARDVEQKAFLAAGFQAVVTKPILDLGELFRSITGALAWIPDLPAMPSAGGSACLDSRHLDSSHQVTP
jgi:CheY-like chemotaxis protein